MTAFAAQFIKARAEEREREALRQYRSARDFYLTTDQPRDLALRDALIARSRWTVLADLLGGES